MTSEFVLTDLWGDMHDSNDPQAIAALLQTLDQADREHGDVSIKLPNEWSISVYANGNVVYENLESRTDQPRHMTGVPRAEAIRVANLLISEDFEALEAESWLPGYPKRA